MSKKKIVVGLIGGLGPLAGSDILFKLVQASTLLPPEERVDIIFEQHDYDNMDALVDDKYNPSSRKFYVFNVIKDMERRGVDLILLGCFVSHSFFNEIQSEVKPKILNIFDAINNHLKHQWPNVKRVGVLTSTFARDKKLFEHNFSNIELIYPENQNQNDTLLQAIYGKEGIKAGYLNGTSIEIINDACNDLIKQNVDIIIPGYTEIPLVIDALRNSINIPILDVNKIYAESAIKRHQLSSFSDFKLGIVGGVGPAATVDFMDKIIALTKAQNDQDHIRMLVEHNPKIPDRTKNLIADGIDPSISIYSACIKLEQGGANAIVIPCNTAHAFIDRILPFIQTPIINMLEETAKQLSGKYPNIKKVGLLATTGTIQSQLYQHVLMKYDFDTVVPEKTYQDKVMTAIYGEQGVKAGFNLSECSELLMSALNHLVNNGADAVILGCTELPLIIPRNDHFRIAKKAIPLLDPTHIVAQKCVALATNSI